MNDSATRPAQGAFNKMNESTVVNRRLHSLTCFPAQGGWPSFNDFCVHHFHRGCPILAFFARVGGDDACTTWFAVPRLSVRVDDFYGLLRYNAPDRSDPCAVVRQFLRCCLLFSH
jgi:hypothetical protein